MIRLHPTTKRTATGFVPMVTLRADTGRMIGSRVPKGDARYFRTFDCQTSAEIEARVIALRVAARLPGLVTVSE